MTQTELDEVLHKHVLYLSGDQTGECADLSDADLRKGDLSDADLRGATLHWADLRGANLSEADLRGADLDYAVWPLWCGSLDVIVDKRIFCQNVYHLCRVVVDDPECKAAQQALYPIANQFHRVEECGRLGCDNGKED